MSSGYAFCPPTEYADVTQAQAFVLFHKHVASQQPCYGSVACLSLVPGDKTRLVSCATSLQYSVLEQMRTTRAIDVQHPKERR